MAGGLGYAVERVGIASLRPFGLESIEPIAFRLVWLETDDVELVPQ
jgi:hypothetical protein